MVDLVKAFTSAFGIDNSGSTSGANGISLNPSLGDVVAKSEQQNLFNPQTNQNMVDLRGNQNMIDTRNTEINTKAEEEKAVLSPAYAVTETATAPAAPPPTVNQNATVATNTTPTATTATQSSPQPNNVAEGLGAIVGGIVRGVLTGNWFGQSGATGNEIHDAKNRAMADVARKEAERALNKKS